MTTTTPGVTVAHTSGYQPLSTTEARDSAADLIRDLASHAGDPDAVRETLLDWLDTEGTERPAMTCMSAVQVVFSDCLTRVPVDEIPAGALTLTSPNERMSTA